MKNSVVLQFIKSNILAIAFLIVLIAIFLSGLASAKSHSKEEALQVAENSVRHAVISCYALEGMYPDSYEYLKDNYGLKIDEGRYIVHYEIFASNIMPDITVLER